MLWSAAAPAAKWHPRGACALLPDMLDLASVRGAFPALASGLTMVLVYPLGRRVHGAPFLDAYGS